MKGKLHLLGGIIAGVSCAILISQNTNELGAAFFAVNTVAGSVFPDIDVETSMVSKKLKITSKVVNKCFGHRGLFHSPLFAVLFSSLISFAYYYIFKIEPALYGGIGFLFGYFIHLLQDLLTMGGIPILYPISKTKFSLLKIRSGSNWNYLTMTILTFVWIRISSYAPMIIEKGVDIYGHLFKLGNF